MEPECSLPRSQVPATCPYREPAQSSPYPHIPLPEDPSYIILPSLSLRFPHQNPVYPSPLPMHAPCSAHLILLNFITRNTLGEQYGSLSSSCCSFLLSPVTSSLLGPNILNILISITLSLGFSLIVSDQVSHPHFPLSIYNIIIFP